MSSEDPTRSIDAARDFVLQAFRIACAAHRLCNDDARNALAQIVDMATADLAASCLPLPATAPERWENRVGRTENPPVFIRRVYAQYLHGGFTRAMLRNLDAPLYRALAVWEIRHPDEHLREVPKRPRRNPAEHVPN